MVEKTINTAVINSQDRGHILSYAATIETAPPDAGSTYLTAYGKPIVKQDSESFQVRASAEPTILGYIDNISDGPDITGGGIAIKEQSSCDIAVPEIFETFLPVIKHSADDVLNLYGAAGFQNASLHLILQRTTIAPDEAHRLPFANWHNHMKTGRVPSIDLVYAFSDVSPTEFLIDHKETRTQDKSLTRFGAEIQHRSPKNNTGAPLRRTWGAIIVMPHIPTQAPSKNQLLSASEEMRHAFADNAQNFMRSTAQKYFTATEPSPAF